ncbi:MAG: TolC family protein [Pirellulales bacterium]|nr:TolC family protein [Pirellulales bacterium]
MSDDVSASQMWLLPPVEQSSSAVVPVAAVDTPETLVQAWDRALAVGQELKASRWSVSSARQALCSAQADRWPTLAVEGGYVARSASPAFQFDIGGLPLPTNEFHYRQDESAEFRGLINLPLYTSGRIQHGIAAAQAEVGSTSLGVENAQSDLLLSVVERYVAVLRAEYDLDVTVSTVRNLESHAHDVEKLFTQRQVPKNDLLAARVSLSNARQESIRARTALDSSRAAYNRLLDRPHMSEVRIAPLALEHVEGDVELFTARALQMRPEISRYGMQIQALRHRAAALSAKNKPHVNLQGRYDFEENRYQAPEGIATVGVLVNWNVFDGGKKNYQATTLLHRAESLAWAKRDLESQIALAVRQAWLDIKQTHQRLDVTTEAIAQAEENLRVSRKRYAAGACNNTEVLDAEALRTQAYRNHHDAKYDAILAVFHLRHAMGDMYRHSVGQ